MSLHFCISCVPTPQTSIVFSPLESSGCPSKRLSYGYTWKFSAYAMKSTSRLKRKSCFSASSAEIFHVATFLLFYYNGSAFLINKSSIPALIFFLQWIAKYITFLLQLILNLSILGFFLCWSKLPPGWVEDPCHTWGSTKSTKAEAISVDLLTWEMFSTLTAAPIQKSPGFQALLLLGWKSLDMKCSRFPSEQVARVYNTVLQN